MTSHSSTRLPRLALGGAVLGLVLVGCSGVSGLPSAPAEGAGSPTVGLPSETLPTLAPGISEGVPSTVIDAAVADAATRAGVSLAEAALVSAEPVTFPDGGLGCPEPGVLYTQVLTPGYRVVVEAGGREYDYRASTRGGTIRWCENPPAG
jgi:hypothetical protein